VVLNRSKKIKKEKMMKKKIAVIALGVMAVLVAGQEAGACMAESGPTAYAELDWTSFQVLSDVLPIGATYVRSNEDEYSYSRAGTNNDDDYGAGWTDIGVKSEAWGSHATGSANNTKMSSYSMLNYGEESVAHSYASRAAEFAITKTGLFIVSIDYSWKVSLAEGQEGTQKAQAWCNISLHDADYSVYGDGGSEGSLPNDATVFFDDQSGMLMAGVYAIAGTTMYFEAQAGTYVEAAAPVPVPPALWLLGSGVFGLLIRKKKNLA
jgi:hypothetical protein